MNDRDAARRPRTDRRALTGPDAPATTSPAPDEHGHVPMTTAQRSYLHTLAREAGEEVPDPELPKAEATLLIARLQRATGRIPPDRPLDPDTASDA